MIRKKQTEEQNDLNTKIDLLNQEKETCAAELNSIYKDIAQQIEERGKLAVELAIANLDLNFQNEEKSKLAEELIKANKELAFLNTEQQSYFASIVNTSDDAIISKTLNGVITSWNHGAEKLFGYKADEIIGKNVLQLIPKELQNEEAVIISKIKNGEKVDHYETLRVKKDGTIFNVSLTISPLKNFEGKIIGASKILRDITKRKKEEADKKLLTDRLLLATKSAKMGIWEWDIINNTLTWDEGMYFLFNMKKGESAILNEEWISKIHLEDIELVNEKMQKALDYNEEYNPVFRVVWQDASIHYIEGSGIIERDEQGKAIRMIGANWDITEIKIKEAQLKLLESVITNTTDSVIITEAEPFDEPGNRILYVNNAFTKMTGYTSEEVMGKTPRILQGINSDRIELKRLGEAIRKWQPYETTIINYRKNGEEFWINFSLTPVANEKGWFTHWIAIERDVSVLKNYINALENQNMKLKEIAWTQSHIVRAPLARMMGIVHLIKDIEMETKEYNEWIERFTDSANELDTIIKDISSKAQTVLLH